MTCGAPRATRLTSRAPRRGVKVQYHTYHQHPHDYAARAATAAITLPPHHYVTPTRYQCAVAQDRESLRSSLLKWNSLIPSRYLEAIRSEVTHQIKERNYIHGTNTKLIYILGYFGTVYAPRFMVAEPAHFTIQESYRQNGSYHWQLTRAYAHLAAEHL